MINIRIQDIETLFNTIKDLYHYELNRADKDKLLSEITKRAENPRSSKIINLSITKNLKNLIITNSSYGNILKELTIIVYEDFQTPKILPMVLTFKLYQL